VIGNFSQSFHNNVRYLTNYCEPRAFASCSQTLEANASRCFVMIGVTVGKVSVTDKDTPKLRKSAKPSAVLTCPSTRVATVQNNLGSMRMRFSECRKPRRPLTTR
jgi:hypothetical protein